MDFESKEYLEIKKLADDLRYEDWKSKKHTEIDYELPKLNKQNLTTIKKFYENKNVFVTGGNGFMGKVLIEKLLRSCPGINKIYLLMRLKKGIPPEKRLNDMLQSPVFDVLKKERPDAVSKILIIHGDCAKTNLGMSDKDIEFLKENTHVIFHVAASVRFDDSLKKAILMNTRSTRDLIKIATEMKNLKVFVHVSTAYCNIDKKVIEEKVYPDQADWQQMIQMAETLDEDAIRALEPKILNGFPNTYTFTKSLAENIVNTECENLPTVIFRPSIVFSSEKEPIPGWVDSLNGPLTFYVAVGTGFLHVSQHDEDLFSDYIPVDNAIINMIVASWYQANNSIENIKRCLVINACTSNISYFTYRNINASTEKLMALYPFGQRLGYPFLYAIKDKFQYEVSFFIIQLIPCVLMQGVLNLIGHGFPVLKMCRKSYSVIRSLNYFMSNEWEFKNGNYLSLCKIIKTSDKDDFYSNVKEADVFNVVAYGLYGLKKYMFNEDPDDEDSLSKARALYKRFHTIHRIFLLVFWTFTFFVIWKYLSAKKVVDYIIN